MTIQGLVQSDPQADPENGKVYYERVVLTVGKPSQYNDPVTKRPKGCGFREIESFWNWSETVLMGESPPPVEGDVISVSLATKPMANKPGYKYHDIVAVYRTDKQPIASQRQQQPSQGASDWPSEAQQAVSGVTVTPVSYGLDTPAGRYLYDPKHYYFEDKGERKTAQILKSQAWNGLTAMLANQAFILFTDDEKQEMWDDWHAGYEALKAGRVPFNEPAEQDECPHDVTLGVAPPEGGFKAGDATETCKQCGEGTAWYSHQPQQESGMPSGERVAEDDDVIDMPW